MICVFESKLFEREKIYKKMEIIKFLFVHQDKLLYLQTSNIKNESKLRPMKHETER